MNDDKNLLTPPEIAELTNRKRHKAQVRMLARMGIRCIVRPDGTIAVARALVNALLAGYADTPPASGRGVMNLEAARRRRPKA